MLLPRTSSPGVRVLLLSSSSVLITHISCLSHICHRLVADQLSSGYLSCLSQGSVLVAHILYPYLPYVAVVMSFDGTSLKSSNPFETAKLTWLEGVLLDLKTWRLQGPGSSTSRRDEPSKLSRRTAPTPPRPSESHLFANSPAPMICDGLHIANFQMSSDLQHVFFC